MVTFRTHSHRDIDMFTGDAHTMLKLMGLSTTVPSALQAEDVQPALDQLKQAIERHEVNQPPPASDEEPDDEDGEEPTPVPLDTRALPLIELLETAAEANEHVIWE